MLKVTFKDVGQGDSILIEWKTDDGLGKLGIIDSNLLEDGNNPVLDYLKSTTYREIEFILLSHPHYDHFSGLRQIVEYCEANKIPIKQFWHTSSQTPDFLKSSVKAFNAQKEVALLFRKVHTLFRSGKIIENQGYIDDTTKNYRLNSEIEIQFLAPSTKETDKYISNIPLKYNEEDAKNRANANWLSTVIKISGRGWYVLLTSDCEEQVLKQIWKKSKQEFKNQSLLLAQSPHHGAAGNHREPFWKSQNLEKKQIASVISVGKNHYRHPSQKTIESFDKLGYKIYATNTEGYLSHYSESDIEIGLYLDTSSSKVLRNNKKTELSGDQSFEIKDGFIKYQK